MVKKLPLLDHQDDDSDCDDRWHSPKHVRTATVSGGERLSLAANSLEVEFFTYLHSELRKATKFFEMTEKELVMREERIREGVKVVRKPDASVLTDRWLGVARSVFGLYKELLTLEVYAIMSFVSFSKILKKHDKITHHPTRSAYMCSFVEKANFASYPRLLQMMHICQSIFDEASDRIEKNGTSHLHDDERLFLFMIRKIGNQASSMTPSPVAGVLSPQEVRLHPAIQSVMPSLMQSLQTSPDRHVSGEEVQEAGKREQSSGESSNDERHPWAVKRKRFRNSR